MPGDAETTAEKVGDSFVLVFTVRGARDTHILMVFCSRLIRGSESS